MNDEQLRFHGLARPPFEDASESHGIFRGSAFAALTVGIIADIRDGNVVIGVRGVQGIGKTYFTDVLAGQLDSPDFLPVQAAGGSASPRGIQRLLADAAGLSEEKPDPARLLKALQVEFNTTRLILIVDGAELLPPAVFHYLWQIIELCRMKSIRLHLVMIGDAGTWPGLNAPGLTEMRRAAISSHMIPGLTEQEAAEYLDRRLQAAGRSLTELMPRRAVAELIEQACGIPGRLNELTETALSHAYENGARRITLPMLRKALAIKRQPTPILEYVRPLISLPAMAAAAAVIAIVGVVALASGSDVAPPRRDMARLAGAWSNPGTGSRQDRLAVASVSPATARDAGEAAPSAAEGAVASAAAPQAASPNRASAKPVVFSRAVSQPQPSQVASAQGPVSDTPSSPDIPANGTPPSPPKPDFVAPTLARSTADRSRGQGLVLIATAGDNIASLYRRVYRGVEPPPYTQVVAANRAPIRQGSLVVFPEPPHGWTAK